MQWLDRLESSLLQGLEENSRHLTFNAKVKACHTQAFFMLMFKGCLFSVFMITDITPVTVFMISSGYHY